MYLIGVTNNGSVEKYCCCDAADFNIDERDLKIFEVQIKCFFVIGLRWALQSIHNFWLPFFMSTFLFVCNVRNESASKF